MRPARSLIALATLLVLATLAMEANAFAVSGSSGDGSAAQAQYPKARCDPSSGEVGGARRESLEGDASVRPLEGDASGGRRCPGTGDSLPFTGWAAIALFIGGVGMVATGLTLRRSARASSD